MEEQSKLVDYQSQILNNVWKLTILELYKGLRADIYILFVIIYIGGWIYDLIRWCDNHYNVGKKHDDQRFNSAQISLYPIRYCHSCLMLRNRPFHPPYCVWLYWI